MMLELDLTPTRGRRLIVAAGAVLALAACSEESTAPHARATPTRPNAYAQLPVETRVTARFVDQNGDPAPNLSVGITPYRSYTYWVGDHEMWGDEDPRKGFISTHLPTAPSYMGCFPLSSSAWVWDGDGCRTVTPVNGTADLGVFKVYRRPELTFYTYDRQGHIIEGASVRITGPNGFDTTVMDAASGGSLNGIIHLALDRIGTFNYCETVPPPGYQLSDTRCGTVTVWWGQKPVIQLKHEGAIDPSNPF